MKVNLAIDAGGTFFKSAVFLENGKQISDVNQTAINSNGDIEEIIDGYRKVIELYNEKFEIVNMGISTPGPFNYYEGKSLMRHKFSSIYGIDLRNKISKIINKKIPIQFFSDSNAFLAGELYNNNKIKSSTVIGITIGTGLGFAISKNSKVLTNLNGGPFDALYNEDYKGEYLENYISGKGIVKIYKLLGGQGEVTALDIAKDYNNIIAKKTFDEFGDILGNALLKYVKKYNADYVVVGGQVAKSFDYFKESMQKKLLPTKCIAIQSSNIDNNALRGVEELIK